MLNPIEHNFSSELKGKSGVIFGGSSGVGAALVDLLADTTDLIVASRRGTSSSKARGVVCDVCDYEAVSAVLNQCGRTPDFIISCVGVGFYAPLSSDYSQYWKKILETNVVGNLNILSNILCLAPNCSQVLIMGSLASHRPSNTPGNAVYRASKIALAALIEDFRFELRKSKNLMRVCNISPGFISGTDFTRRYFESNLTEQKNILGDFDSLTPDEVAKVICDILSYPSNIDFGEVVLRPVAQPT